MNTELRKNQMARRMLKDREHVKGSGGSVWALKKKDFHKHLDLKYAGFDKLKNK